MLETYFEAVDVPQNVCSILDAKRLENWVKIIAFHFDRVAPAANEVQWLLLELREFQQA